MADGLRIVRERAALFAFSNTEKVILYILLFHPVFQLPRFSEEAIKREHPEAVRISRICAGCLVQKPSFEPGSKITSKTKSEREGFMQTSNVQPARTAVLPTTVAPVIRRCSPWPFPAGEVRRRTDDISATAQAVIATTARAYLS